MWCARAQLRRPFLTGFVQHGRKFGPSPAQVVAGTHPSYGPSSSFCSNRSSRGSGNRSLPGGGVSRGAGLKDRRPGTPSISPTNDDRHGHGRRPRKVSFDDAVLKPAFKGELAPKHSSGIPRLAARRHKARLTPQPARAGAELTSMMRDDDSSSWDDELEDGGGSDNTNNDGEYDGEYYDDDQGDNSDYEGDDYNFKMDKGKYQVWKRFHDNSKHYWREYEYDTFTVEDFPEESYDEKGRFEIAYGKDDLLKMVGNPSGDQFERRNYGYENVESDNDEDTDDGLSNVNWENFNLDNVDFGLDDADLNSVAFNLDSDEDSDESDDDNDDDDDDVDDDAENLGDDKLDVDDSDDFKSNDPDLADVTLEPGDHAKIRSFVLNEPTGQRDSWQCVDPEEFYFYGQNDVFHLASLEPGFLEEEEPELCPVLPLRRHGPDLDDFLSAVIDHPSKYAVIESKRPHVESMREPKAFFPKDRLNPPLDFVNAHARFMFVAGLPSLEVDGKVADLTNPVHCSYLQRNVSSLVSVDPSCVFPASLASAFVGFPSEAELLRALMKGPGESLLFSPPIVSRWRKDVPPQWAGQGDGVAIVQLSNIPPGNTGLSLRQALIPEGSELEAVYGNVTPQDFYFQSSTSVLLRLASSEEADSAVSCRLLNEQLHHLGQYVPRLYRARRELVHGGWERPRKLHEKRVVGPRLIVDGDMPSKPFYLSHAAVVHARHLDPTLTQEELSLAFEPFCARRRDVAGSVEFVTCSAGLPTGSAYIGFDIPGEAEAAIRAMNGVISLGATRAPLRLVKDRRAPGQPVVLPEKRGERRAEELLDDLDNWEQYANPADLKVLEAAGISKMVLDEALRNIRYSNKTFGSLDSGPRYDALEPDKSSGELYRNYVQLYISTLKDCLASPDDVGAMYEATHFPDEPIDLSIFQREEERQKKLLEKRVSSKIGRRPKRSSI